MMCKPLDCIFALREDAGPGAEAGDSEMNSRGEAAGESILEGDAKGGRGSGNDTAEPAEMCTGLCGTVDVLCQLKMEEKSPLELFG